MQERPALSAQPHGIYLKDECEETDSNCLPFRSGCSESNATNAQIIKDKSQVKDERYLAAGKEFLERCDQNDCLKAL